MTNKNLTKMLVQSCANSRNLQAEFSHRIMLITDLLATRCLSGSPSIACYQERRGLTSTLSLLGSWSEELQGWGLFYPWSLTFLLDLEPSLGREGDLDVAEPHDSCGSDIM